MVTGSRSLCRQELKLILVRLMTPRDRLQRAIASLPPYVATDLAFRARCKYLVAARIPQSRGRPRYLIEQAPFLAEPDTCPAEKF